MNKFTNILLGAVTVTMVGCGSADSTPELEDNIPQDNQNQQGIYDSSFKRGVPDVTEAPTGMEIEFVNYNYNHRLVNDNGEAKIGSRSIQNVYNYTKDTSGQYKFENISKEEYRGISDPQGNVFINKRVQFVLSENESSNDIVVSDDDLSSSSNQVISYNYSNSGNYTLRYNKKLQKNSIVDEIRDNNQVIFRCVVRNILSPLDLGQASWNNGEPIVPTEIVNDINSRLGLGDSLNLNYGVNILQSYCGASDGTIVHSFRAARFGEILNIFVYSDDSVRYKIIHRNSINADNSGSI